MMSSPGGSRTLRMRGHRAWILLASLSLLALLTITLVWIWNGGGGGLPGVESTQQDLQQGSDDLVPADPRSTRGTEESARSEVASIAIGAVSFLNSATRDPVSEAATPDQGAKREPEQDHCENETADHVVDGFHSFPSVLSPTKNPQSPAFILVVGGEGTPKASTILPRLPATGRIPLTP